MDDFKKAVDWAVKELDGDINKILLIDKVREYFDENKISKGLISFKDLEPYI